MKPSPLRSTLFAAFFALASNVFVIHSTNAQNPPPSYEHLKELEPFIGTWTTPFDPPGNAPVGTLEVRFKWMVNKSYVQSEVHYKTNQTRANETLNPEFTIIGYDSDEAATKAWVFKYLDQGKMSITIQPDRYVLHQHEGEKGEANYRSQTKVIELIEEDEMVVTITSDSTESGPKEEPVLKLTRQR